MNTSTQHSSHLSGAIEEGNLNVSRTSFIPSEDALLVKQTVDGITERVGGAIEVMKKRRDNFIQTDPIIKACELSKNTKFVLFAKLIQETGNVNEKDSSGDTALMLASQEDSIEAIRLLLAHPAILVNEKDKS